MMQDKKDTFKKYLTECCKNTKLYDIIIAPFQDGQNLLYRAIVLGKKWVIEYIFSQSDEKEQKQITNILFNIFLPNQSVQLSPIGLAHFAHQIEIANFLEQKANLFFSNRSVDNSMNNLEAILKNIEPTSTGNSFPPTVTHKTISSPLPSTSFFQAMKSRSQTKDSTERKRKEPVEWFRKTPNTSTKKSRTRF